MLDQHIVETEKDVEQCIEEYEMLKTSKEEEI
jgi:hypothetical protein